jgi:uncharacterized membrane protein YkvA (DUF1232 family)
MSQYSRTFSEEEFTAKLGALGALRDLIDAAKRLHAMMRDPATPLWVKGVCIAALGYLIVPTDVVTDFIPVLGYSDDLTMLTAALTAIASQWRQDQPPAVISED